MKKKILRKRALDLISSIFYHGDFKPETVNEKELQKILTELGKWPTEASEIIERHKWWDKQCNKESQCCDLSTRFTDDEIV